MPSSPNGPCSTGNTTSTPSSPPPGRQRHRARRRGATRRRGRSRPSQASWPAARSPSRTDAAEASDTSCSDERPPPSTATRAGLTSLLRRRGRAGRRGRRRGARRSGRRRRDVLADHDRHVRLLLGLGRRGRSLARDDAVLALVGDGLLLHGGRRSRRRPAWPWPSRSFCRRTFGTATVGGALATTRVTVEPVAADLPAGRALARGRSPASPWSRPRWS